MKNGERKHKRTTVGRALRRLSLALGTVAFAAYSPLIAGAANGAGGGPLPTSVLGSGSDTTQFMMSNLDALYMGSPGCAQGAVDGSCTAPDLAGTVTTENYAHDQTHEAYFLGSSNGIKQLCNKGQAGVAPVDFARSSRAKKSTDCAGLHFVAYALDGISWEGFDQASPVSGIHLMNNQAGTCSGSGSGGNTPFCLSQAQLQGIFITCTITNWNQVGSPNNVPISIYTPQAGSGTRSTWDTFLGGDSSHCIPTAQLSTHVIAENSNTGIPTSDRAGSIFPFSRGVFTKQSLGSTGEVLGSVDNISPTIANISTSTFPFTRSLYNVFCTATCAGGASSPATVNYVGEDGWICKAGQPPAAPNSAHTVNPATGNNYRTDIETAITNEGFAPIAFGSIGSPDPNQGYCRLTVTP